MKSILALLILVPAFSYALRANPECGLPSSTTEDDGFQEINESQSLDISRLNKFQINSLPRLVKQQLIIAAHQQDSNIKLKFDNKNLQLAIESLKDASEAGDLNVSTFYYSRRQFTYVMYYPGGNEGGFIFNKGSADLLASVGDQDINCWK